MRGCFLSTHSSSSKFHLRRLARRIVAQSMKRQGWGNPSVPKLFLETFVLQPLREKVRNVEKTEMQFQVIPESWKWLP